MHAGTRLALYGAGLVVAFGGAFGLAGVVVPDSAPASWEEGTEMSTHDRLSLDFQVDDQVHTAELVLDAPPGDEGTSGATAPHDETPSHSD